MWLSVTQFSFKKIVVTRQIIVTRPVKSRVMVQIKKIIIHWLKFSLYLVVFQSNFKKNNKIGWCNRKYIYAKIFFEV